MKYIELFAGIGGFRRGLETLGHQCVGWVEWDKFARQSYESIWPNARDEWNATDITGVTDESLRQLSRDVGGVELLAFGFPCQSFSVAGKRGGFEDTRGTLFFEAARFAMVLGCKYLLAENVVGLLNHDEGRTFHTILCALDELGYDAEWQVFNAKNFGIPQNRERVFLVGRARGRSGRKVFPILNDGGENSPSLNELSSGVADAHRVYDGAGLARTLKAEGGGLGAKTGLYQVSKTVRASGQGSYDGKHTWNLVQTGVVRRGTGEGAEYSERDIALTLDANYYKGLDAHQARTGVAVRAVLTPDREEKRQNGRRIKEDGDPMFTLTGQDRHGVMIAQRPRGNNKGGLHEVSPTVSASYFENNNHLVTETRIRRLTPLECWRLMGRSDWEFGRAKAAGTSDSQLYKQAGNSLCPAIVTEIAKRLE